MTSPVASPPSAPAARVVLKPRKALPFYGRHPWVLASAVDCVEPLNLESEHLLDLDGQIVELVNEKRKFIAHGIFNSQSRIRVRLYSWQPDQPIDEAFFRQKIAAAIDLRRQLGYEPPTHRMDTAVNRLVHEPPQANAANRLAHEPTHSSDYEKGSGVDCGDAYPHGNSLPQPTPDPLSVPPQSRATSATRLFFSEADGLSGLIIDRYGDYLVLQPTALGIAQRLEPIVRILQDLLQPKAIVLKLDQAMAKLEGMTFSTPANEPANAQSPHASPPDGHTWGHLPEGPITIDEHGLAYEVDLRAGQKTGLYLDQRENRLAAAKYLGGRRVLDMFCYTGGFALTAAKHGGAAEVLGIDGSKRAIEQARKNAELNGFQSVRFETGDGFQTLDTLTQQNETFDAVILDPPKFARGRSGINAALMAYHRLNRTAVGLLKPGGILITCSCTGGVSREDFLHMLSGVAQKSRREIRILEQRGAGPDHPVSATCLESEYLKCTICEIR